MDWGDTSSHNTGKSIVAAEEQTALEDVNHLDDEEKDNETKEGVTDDLNQFLYPKYSENSKVGESCVLCGFASSATKKRWLFLLHEEAHEKKAWKRGGENLEIKLEKTNRIFIVVCKHIEYFKIYSLFFSLEIRFESKLIEFQLLALYIQYHLYLFIFFKFYICQPCNWTA